jgi:hypothetical protein
MYKKVLSLLLVSLLLNVVGVQCAYGASKEEKEAKFTQKFKEGVGRLGVGPEAQIEVKLKDNTKLKGYVREAGPDSFVIVDAKTGAATEVPYPQVKQARGNNLSTHAKIALWVSVAVGITLLVSFLVVKAASG